MYGYKSGIPLSLMMKYLKYFVIIALPFLITNCGDSVLTNNTSSESYKNILSGNAGNLNISLYITGYDSITTGYNELYFKVKNGSTEMTKGKVKIFPKMWMTPTYMHSTPVDTSFEYDNNIGYFKGYAIFNMPTSPPQVVWYSVLTYKDENGINHTTDSIPTYTSYHKEKQWRLFFDESDQSSYFITLVKPFTPSKGLNSIWLLLHKTDQSLINFEQIRTAQMHVAVYELDSANQSIGNISPQSGTDGIFKGIINLPYVDQWNVCDTIFYNGHYITNNPPPMPEFNFFLN